MNRIRVSIRSPAIGVKLKTQRTGVDMGRVVRIVEGEHYTGAYEVDPDFDGVTLPTIGKLMDDDVTVNPIEVQRVSNPQGGITVYIGGILNG